MLEMQTGSFLFGMSEEILMIFELQEMISISILKMVFPQLNILWVCHTTF